MKKTALKLTPRNIYQTAPGRWVFRKEVNKQAIYRTLKSNAHPTADTPIPAEVLEEVEGIVGLALTGQLDEYAATKKRKDKAATIGEIVAAFEAWPLTKALTWNTRTEYLNALYQIIATIHLPEYANLSGSRNSGTGKSQVERRNEAINKLSSNILTPDLINRWIAKRLDRGPVYRAHEIVPEKDSAEMTKKELRRVLLSIRTAVTKARSIFAKNGRVTGEMMCPKNGAYRNLKLPNDLEEFLGKKTTKPGKNTYKAPTQMEILDLISGLPELHQSHPEAYKAFKIAYGTGLRIDEIRKLKWTDIADDDEGFKITLEETKNGDERINEYLGERLFRELWDMKTDKVYVIGGGKVYRKYHLAKDVSAYFRSKEWHRNQCLHELRKYFGCLLAKETKDLVVVMHALGHQDVSTTRNYYHDKIGKTHNPDFAASLPAPGLEKVA